MMMTMRQQQQQQYPPGPGPQHPPGPPQHQQQEKGMNNPGAVDVKATRTVIGTATPLHLPRANDPNNNTNKNEEQQQQQHHAVMAVVLLVHVHPYLRNRLVSIPSLMDWHRIIYFFMVWPVMLSNYN
mmetsp:Transcript_1879/g.2143  ORF Transcript_1879/g.2143 Transcript_1879/m.2143 type:complete len:127 (+) Transcript_1879:376-756(+)